MTKPKKMHLWIPELFSSKGGIQVFSGFFLRAVQNLYPQADLAIFIKNDTNQIIRDCKDVSINNGYFYGTGTTSSPFRTIVFALRLIISAIVQKPDLIVMTHLNFAPIALLLKKLIGTKYVVIAHGVEAWDIDNQLLKSALHNADSILAVSKYTRDRLHKEQGLSLEKIGILHNTFDADNWKIAPKPEYLLAKYGLKREQKIILTVSRLVESEQYKGYDKLLEVMPVIRKLIPDVHYVIIGKGSDLDRLQQIIKQKHIQDCVTLAGFIPDAELCDYYNLCDLFAMPSKSEGFGIVYLEALASGKPVMGGNLDGATDALCDGKLGALVNPDDLQEITDTIFNILVGSYPNKKIYQPQKLREECINTFGFSRFRENIGDRLQQFELSPSTQ
ncbi:MAG: glycosyltransferase [Oscillatoriales cyanobacterium CG2_30_44_21]|nr:MAG: glycosyltransferase [Oscillatoriales cyanobacterium CG2_30_44_21]